MIINFFCKCSFIKYAAIIAAIFFSGCSGADKRENAPGIRFAIFGNTSPDSPFRGFTERLPDLINQINSENPVLTIHTGNMVHGGHEWMGINEADVTRQYELFSQELSRLKSIPYTIAGKKDLFNSKYLHYKKYMKREKNYSFNYAGIHFIVINTVNIKKDEMENNIKWVLSELAKTGNSPVFAITHYPLFTQKYIKRRVNQSYAESLHRLFRQYGVRYVFSGRSSSFYELTLDGIKYFVTGTGGYTEEDIYRRYHHFYLVSYDGKNIRVEPKELPPYRSKKGYQGY